MPQSQDPSQPPRAASAADALRREVDLRLAALLPARPADVLGAAMRHAALGPGRRLRPLLTLLAAQELGLHGPASAAALDGGCAIEFVHAASLALDDLPAMDDAPWRREQRATHVEHGEDLAILAAVALLAQAFAIVATLPDVDAPRRARLGSRLADVVARLTQGQASDLRRSAVDASALAQCSSAKTAALFELGVDIAAAAAGCGHDDARALALARCAQHLGVAYQMLDDLHDAGIDQDRSSHVMLLGAAGTRRALADRVEAALDQLPRRDGPLGGFVVALFA